MRESLKWVGWLMLATAIGARAQAPPDGATWAADLTTRYWIAPNITYLVADGVEAKLDVFVPRDGSAKAPRPTVIYLHGGGWTGGDKVVATLRLLPYLEMGWAAVNVDYRLTVAPAAVEDCRCALRWVIQNAAKYGFDVDKLVVTGDSAGSHLALTTGMLPSSAGFDTRCPGSEELRVAAVVNWTGVTDVLDVVEGERQQPYAVRWLSEGPGRDELARRLSPLTYVRAGLPPIFTVHGDADTSAPYSHAVRLHQALDAAKVPNRLLTMPGRGHGDFSRDEVVMIYGAIREFLGEQGLKSDYLK